MIVVLQLTEALVFQRLTPLELLPLTLLLHYSQSVVFLLTQLRVVVQVPCLVQFSSVLLLPNK
jgi:hypothetical protein